MQSVAEDIAVFEMMEDYKVSRRLGKAATLPTAPAWSMLGRHERMNDDPGPGPGQYGPGAFPHCRGGGFGSSHRDGTPHDRSPSPMDYQPDIRQTNRHSPAYSLGASRPTGLQRGAPPGPGTYDSARSSPLTRPSPPCFSLLARWSPDNTAQRTPGPTDYCIQYGGRKSPHGASLKFRHESTSAGNTRLEPGPGEYDVLPRRSSSVGKSFGGSRYYPHLDTSSPGPGFYTPDDHITRKPVVAHMLSRSLRDGLEDPEAPGPGQYSNVSVNQRPAGHSVVSPNRSSPSFSFGGKVFAVRDPGVPGPSDYGLPNDPTRRSFPSFSLVSAWKPDGGYERRPGPGAYNPSMADDVVKRSSLSAGIAFRLEEPKVVRSPGPAAYHVRINTKPGVSLKFRHVMKSDNMDTPSPLEYADKDFKAYIKGFQKSGAKGFSFARRYKDRAVEAVPGPQYSVGCSTLGVASSQPVFKSRLRQTVVL